MEQLDAIILFSLIMSAFQFYFEKLVYAPQPVKSDPYWRAIYGTDEFSPQEIQKRKRLEKEKEEMMDELVKETNFNIADIPSMPQEEIEVSIDAEAKDFILQLQNEFGDETKDSIVDSDVLEPKESIHSYEINKEVNKSSEQLKMEVKDNNLVFQDDGNDYLDVSDLDMPIYHNRPSTSKIKEIGGPQQWYVVVIGKEGTYLHVTDGMKRWIDLGYKAHDICINDTLMLMVEWIEENINVLDIIVLPNEVSH